jgi:hypothetical protein
MNWFLPGGYRVAPQVRPLESQGSAAGMEGGKGWLKLIVPKKAEGSYFLFEG